MSLFKTLAAKRKTSVKQVAESLKLEDGSYGIHYQMKGEERTLKLFRLKTWRRPHGGVASVDKEPKVAQYTLARSELIRRLNASQCEYCETKTGPFEVHHVRGLKSITVGKGTVATDYDCKAQEDAGSLQTMSSVAHSRKTSPARGAPMKVMVYGEPDNWKRLRPVRWGDAVLSEQSEARFLPCGTVLVECKKQGIPSVGIEASPMAQFASQVKVDWSLEPEGLMEHARHVAAIRYKGAKCRRD